MKIIMSITASVYGTQIVHNADGVLHNVKSYHNKQTEPTEHILNITVKMIDITMQMCTVW